ELGWGSAERGRSLRGGAAEIAGTLCASSPSSQSDVSSLVAPRQTTKDRPALRRTAEPGSQPEPHRTRGARPRVEWARTRAPAAPWPFRLAACPIAAMPPLRRAEERRAARIRRPVAH